jgi:hypothetical protein
MMIALGIMVAILALVGGMLIYRNNRERADKVVDKSEAILDILKK